MTPVLSRWPWVARPVWPCAYTVPAVGDVALGRDLDVARGADRFAVFQTAGCRDDDITDAGVEGTGVTHANPGFAPDQHDFLGIHAPQGRDIDGKGRGGANAADRRGRGDGGIDLIGAGDDIELFRPEAGIDLHGTGDEVGIVCGTGIESGAADRHLSALHPIAVEIAIGTDHRHAGGRRHPVGVEEAAAGAADPRGNWQ